MQPIAGLAPDSPSLIDLGGTIWPIDTKDVPLAYNPAVCIDSDGKLAIVVRRSNYQLDTKFGSLTIPSGARSVQNVTYFSYLSDDLSPEGWSKVSFFGGPELRRGPEDARLIRRGSKFYLNVVLLERDIPRARVGLYELSEDMSATHIETYPGEVDSKPEKNWMTHLQLDDPEFKFIQRLDNNIRGGSSLIPWGDGYLALCHKTYLKKNRYYNPLTFGIQEGIERTYTHLFAEFDSKLNLKKISKEFFLIDRGIEFATGLVELGTDLLVSFGRHDKEAWFGKLPTIKVKEMLNEGE
jgi:hypothetical protein